MTNSESLYNKLTSSAKEAFEKAVQDYKNSVLEKANRNSEGFSVDNPEISLRDILEAIDNENLRKKRLEYSDYKRRRFMFLITFSGGVYAVAGLLIYLIQNKKFSLENDLGLVIAITGILISFMAVLFNQYFTMRKRLMLDFKEIKDINKINPDYKIVERWQIIEKLVAREFGDSNVKNRKYSFNMIMNTLYIMFDSEEDRIKIKELLNTRNLILHDSLKMSESKRIDLLKFADEIINRLEKNN
jgi:hypothetical protein